MKVFEPLYDWVLKLSRHPKAEKYLAGISFLESSVFPIPTAIMLAPMVMAKRDRAWWLATLATITSVLGGLFGYLLGYFLFDQIGKPVLEFYGAWEKFDSVKSQFLEHGVWLVVLAGLTPIPYKLCTLASGVMGLAILPFTIGSLIGRASQFFLVAGVLWWGGPKIEPVLRKWMEILGWLLVVLAVLAYLYFR